MNIRKAEEKDIPRLLALLGQVLQIHAEIRPDVFIPGTTKYTVRELAEAMDGTLLASGLVLAMLAAFQSCRGIL